MSNWERESFDTVINQGLFHVTDHGPLHAPIISFSLKRNEKLRLILETQTGPNAKSTLIERPAGTVRINTETVELTNISAIKANLVGVQPIHYRHSMDYHKGTSTFKEVSQVHSVEATLRNDEPPKYTIDWLENVNESPFVWPHSIDDTGADTKIRTLGEHGIGIQLTNSDERRAFSRSCVKFTVSGIETYLCANWQEPNKEWTKLGCLIYVGTPDETTRTKIRSAVSFSLGFYLVYLGHTKFCKDWKILSFKSVSAYSIDRKVFDLFVLPPAPLGTKYQHEIAPDMLSRMVNAIYSKYDELNFGSLSWAYWHALSATMHIAAAHFGALIEALQRIYLKANPTVFETRLIADKNAWKAFSDVLNDEISKLEISEEDRKIIFNNVSSSNRKPQRMIIEGLLKTLNLKLGVDEDKAWKRRNDAAHGMIIEDGSELDIIQDTKILKVLFHRMILRMTNASDLYFDYSAIGFPVRKLNDAK